VSIHSLRTQVSLWDNRKWLLHTEKFLFLSQSIMDIPISTAQILFFLFCCMIPTRCLIPSNYYFIFSLLSLHIICFLGFKHVLLKNNYCQWPGCESVIGSPEDFARYLIVYCVCSVVYLWLHWLTFCFWLQPYTYPFTPPVEVLLFCVFKIIHRLV